MKLSYPAAHLVYSLSEPEERRMYGRYALGGVPEAQAGLPESGIPFTQPDAYTSDFTIVVAGSNFGCGSSREHAPFALAEAGVGISAMVRLDRTAVTVVSPSSISCSSSRTSMMTGSREQEGDPDKQPVLATEKAGHGI